VKKGDKKNNKRRSAAHRAQTGAQARKRATSVVPLRYIRQARSYPIEGCWVQQAGMRAALPSSPSRRRQPNGNIVFGNYLVDLYCLGLKDTYF